MIGIENAYPLGEDLSNIEKFYKTRNMINCWITDKNERGKRILEGKSTRIP